MAEFKGAKGVWMLYDYDHSPYLVSIHDDELAAIVANTGLGNHIGFLPFGMLFQDAVKKWEGR